ncbi:uncharacterized protein LOC129959662 [Argiope bruennichi]|uniref:uncharacterized protein LOC129959662 n=1 Tax=Argiope bruennichi TaxID=94029 RepID=UPI0024957319|nr:uncharacterized protein LOC129959662 [Argiope bruennichi]
MADDQRAKIISLNRKRGSIKSSLTKLNSFIETNDSKDSIVYQTKLDNLLRIKQNLEQIKEEYFVTAEDSELQELEDSVEELEEECERLEILVVPHQRDYLRILWFDENSHQEVTFRLKTVTYGTSCAPHLAIRTIKQLALDEASDFPLASEMVLRDLYMDDGITGAPDIQTAQILQQQLIKMFARAGMSLHKWTSTSQELLNSFPTSNPENNFPIDEQVSKALGMHWKPFEDLFIFTVKYENKSMLTKRTVLSVVARLYDPLGLLGPVISKMKIFLQKLWLQKLTFDEPLPPAIGKEWSHLVQSLRALELVKIPRWILNENPVKLILHCFSDASEAEYGAVIYLQCISANDIVTSRLVCSKSRVSLLKTVSIPRLELCGCLLAAQLQAKVEKALHLQIDSAVMYTDSTISLAWIQTPPHRLKTFVANKVGKIQQLTQNNKWQHVSSTLNPADVISRGLVPEQLIDNYLWWNGPTFLQELPVSVNCADQQMIDASQDSQFLLELKDNTTHTLVTLNSDFLTNFFKISNKYNKLIRVFSFLLRFLGNCRNKKMKGSLSSKEIEEAEFKLISLVQQNVLADDFKNLASGKQVNPSSKLKGLSPFLDEGSNVIRVGGRLRNADIPFQVCRFTGDLTDFQSTVLKITLDKRSRICFTELNMAALNKFNHLGEEKALEVAAEDRIDFFITKLNDFVDELKKFSVEEKQVKIYTEALVVKNVEAFEAEKNAFFNHNDGLIVVLFPPKF